MWAGFTFWGPFVAFQDGAPLYEKASAIEWGHTLPEIHRTFVHLSTSSRSLSTHRPTTQRSRWVCRWDTIMVFTAISIRRASAAAVGKGCRQIETKDARRLGGPGPVPGTGWTWHYVTSFGGRSVLFGERGGLHGVPAQFEERSFACTTCTSSMTKGFCAPGHYSSLVYNQYN